MKVVDLAFETFGNENNCPLIILHGFLASSRNWRTVAKRLAENHYVYVLDMRNHGASPHAEQMDYPLMAHDVIDFMDKLGLAKAHLLGHSMGGKIAMWFALHYPERVQKLVVADIAPISYEHSFDAVIHALRSLPLDRIKNRKEAEQFLADAIPDAGFRQFLLQNLLLKDGNYFWRINLDFIAKTAHNIVGFPEPARQRLADKALFIAGERSAYIQPDAVLKLFPRAEIVEIANTGHWLYVEAPDIFCQVVDNWLNNRTN
ncbi:MAG: alpha/beta fold hydrolase [Methylomonas sp.]|nr:alpha/beta fold hydrolase [Methylomonas sp.]